MPRHRRRLCRHAQTARRAGRDPGSEELSPAGTLGAAFQAEPDREDPALKETTRHYYHQIAASLTQVSAIPEATASFTLLGLIFSGLLVRRRTKSIRTP